MNILQQEQADGADFRICQQVRNLFPLPGGNVYIPDFVLVYPNGLMRVIECKGGYKGPGFEQGIERYKRTAQLYDSPMCRFELWTRQRDGNVIVDVWGPDTQEINNEQ